MPISIAAICYSYTRRWSTRNAYFTSSGCIMTVYLDNAATTPVDPQVADLVIRLMTEEYGNAGSRTHEFGLEASRVVAKARGRVATAVAAEVDEIVFTS